MHEMVLHAKTDWVWLRLVSDLVNGVPSKASYLEAKKAFEAWWLTIWGVGRFHYRRDPRGVELVQSVWKTIERGAGDCDDWSVIAAASVGALGFPHRFVTVAADPSHPGQPSHVYPQVSIPKNWDHTERSWYGMDLTVKSARFGWEPTGFPSRVWPEPTY